MHNKNFEQHREEGSGCRTGGSVVYDKDGNLLEVNGKKVKDSSPKSFVKQTITTKEDKEDE